MIGSLDGQSGDDTLDFSAYTITRNFILTSFSNDGFNGTDSSTFGTSISGGFLGINVLIGSSAQDSLTGLNQPSVWHITNTMSTYTVNPTLYFSSIETLNGSAFDDSFIFDDGAALPGNIDGKGGTDTLDYSAYTTQVIVKLLNGQATGVLGGVSSIENVIGGQAGDILSGDDKDNLLDGGPGDDYLYGLGGSDILYAGSGFNTLDGGDGYDTGYYLDGHYIDNIYISIENLIRVLPPVIVVPVITNGSKRRVDYILVIPVESGLEVGITCDGCLAVVLLLPNDNSIGDLLDGDLVNFGLGNGTTASLTPIDEIPLPVPLPDGSSLVSGMKVSLFRFGQMVRTTVSRITVSFIVPAAWNKYDLAILFWDETANNGEGAWVEVEAYWAPAWLSDGLPRYEAQVYQTGIYILVARDASN